MFECGQQNELVSVSEKEKCEYVFQMHSPMFCNNDSLLGKLNTVVEFGLRKAVIILLGLFCCHI